MVNVQCQAGPVTQEAAYMFVQLLLSLFSRLGSATPRSRSSDQGPILQRAAAESILFLFTHLYSGRESLSVACSALSVESKFGRLN
jgi:hypothetical protein